MLEAVVEGSAEPDATHTTVLKRRLRRVRATGCRQPVLLALRRAWHAALLAGPIVPQQCTCHTKESLPVTPLQLSVQNGKTMPAQFTTELTPGKKEVVEIPNAVPLWSPVEHHRGCGQSAACAACSLKWSPVPSHWRCHGASGTPKQREPCVQLYT